MDSARMDVKRAGLLVVNFGGPQHAGELTPFLTELLLDVLPGPMAVKRLVAPAFARRRAARIQPAYERIGWSDIVPTHLRQVEALREALGDDAPAAIASGMMFTAPTLRDAVRTLKGRCDWIVALPLFPHYSLATTGAAFQFAWEALRAEGMAHLPVHWVPAWFDHPDYIEALAATIRAGVAATPGDGPVHLLFSPHGLPVSYPRRGDPYPDQVRASVRRVIAHLGWTDPWQVAWQSRVGPAQWMEPSTDQALRALGRAGVTRVCAVPISFVSEHIETKYEIDVEYAELAHSVGIRQFGRAPALGLEPAFIRALADVTRTALTKARYQCVRCLHPQPDEHRRRAGCPSCNFRNPPFLREGIAP